jgi:hypothetical protein
VGEYHNNKEEEMARKFWTLLPDLYYTQKQFARGGRHEILFTAAGSAYLIQVA